MTMTAETWKYVGSQAPASNAIGDVLDALYTLGTKATYYDASGRTQGSGVAGTWSRKQVTGTTEAVYCNPVSNSHTVRWIFAGSASARTPTMASPDTWATSTVLVGFSRSGSTLNAAGNGWDQTLPFDTGSAFSGYSRTCALGTFTITKVHLWECADGFVVVWQTSTAMVETICGLLLDPGVTNTQSPSSAEATSGGRYFLRSMGGTTATSTTSWTTSVTGSIVVFFAHSTSANTPHCYAVTPGAATLVAAERQIVSFTASDTTTQVTPDGDAVFSPLQIGADGGGAFFGRLREICVGLDAALGQTASSSGTVKGYAVSSSPTAAADTMWLMA